MKTKCKHGVLQDSEHFCNKCSLKDFKKKYEKKYDKQLAKVEILRGKTEDLFHSEATKQGVRWLFIMIKTWLILDKHGIKNLVELEERLKGTS